MKWIKDLFSEKSDVSMLRLMSLICCLAAIGIAIHGINRPVVDYSGLTMLCGAFLSAAFIGKVTQKKVEVPTKK